MSAAGRIAAIPPMMTLVTPGGLEPPAYGLGNRRSILLSYGVTRPFCNISGWQASVPSRFGRYFTQSQRLRLKSQALGT